MKNNDVFAGIAAGGVSGRKSELVETMPIKSPENYFIKTYNDITFPVKKEYQESLEEYYRGLKEMREKYKPFTKRKCGDEETNRDRTFLTDFKFRFESDKETINVKIPHYTGPTGRWTAYYETRFNKQKPKSGRSVFIVFKGVDYYADVYINGKHICSHEGFFAAFECDITDFLEQDNILIVKVRNDIPTIGNGDIKVNGDKLYAATGPGWDDPKEGWHHCPAGGGIFDKVYLEERNSLYIDDVFVNPDIEKGTAEVNITVYSPANDNIDIKLSVEIVPYNFEGNKAGTLSVSEPAGYGLNYYQIIIDLQEVKLWQTDSPYMYLCRASASGDIAEKTFGMRKFHMDEKNDPKGTLYLNNKPIILRGANEMGHLQLCVMRGDFDQLIEDILIARYCNMNYYRITQRPVQEEIYHCCDMLGMMNQADLPLFGYMRKNKFHEGVKQAGEMERLTRNHPSVIMCTYINEPFSPLKYDLEYRHMSRTELELFFDACDAAVLFENPKRVIKRVEGDYDPPTNKGMSDFHCYNMWYTNHALPIGMLYKGYLPALKKGWKTGCGEYGTEGLDNYNVMRKYYPSDWLPDNDNDYWLPDKIIKSQTNTMHGDWFEEQSNLRDWIEQSQEHQAFATKLMTLSFRRRSDRIISTAVHLLIDAWPSGWMKTLLDVDRVPKPAYFSIKDSLLPLKVNLRCDRWSGYSLETIEIEAWLLNDKSEDVSEIQLYAGVFSEQEKIDSFKMDIDKIKACSSKAVGLIPVKLPKVNEFTQIEVKICLFSNSNPTVCESMIIGVYPKPDFEIPAFGIGDKAIRLIYDTVGLIPGSLETAEVFVVSSPELLYKNQVPKDIKKIFLTPEGLDKIYKIDDKEFVYKTIFDPDEIGENGRLKGLSIVFPSKEMKEVFHERAFSYWYNKDKDYIDHVAEYYIDGEDIEEFVFGYEKPSWGNRVSGKKKHLSVAAVKDRNVFISLETNGRSGVNPALDKLILQILTEAGDYNKMLRSDRNY